MKHLALLSLFILHFSLFTLSTSAAVPLKWTVDLAAQPPQVFTLQRPRGETYDIEATLKNLGRPFAPAITNACIFWQTNGMENIYWSAPASVSTNTVPAASSPRGVVETNYCLRASWLPSMDPGATTVRGYIGDPGHIYAAAFQFRFIASPGAHPNDLPLPQPVIDFARVTVLNPPWSGGGGGGVDSNAVVNIVEPMIGEATNAIESQIAELQDGKLDSDDPVLTATAPSVGASETSLAGAKATGEALEKKADEFTEWEFTGTQAHDDMYLEYRQDMWWLYRPGGAFYGNIVEPKDALVLDFNGPTTIDHFDIIATRRRVLRTGDAATPQELDDAISATNPTFSNAVLAVGLNIDTNSVAVLNEIAATFGDFPVTGTATTVGGLLAALAAAVAWLRKRAAHIDGNGFGDNDFAADLLGKQVANAKVRYALATTASATMADRTVNIYTLSSGTVPMVFPTATTHDGNTYARDFLLKLTYSGGTLQMPTGVTKVGDELSFEARKTYLIAFTEISADKFYVRSIDITEAQA